MLAARDAPIRTSAAVLDRILATGHPVLVVFETPGCEPCLGLQPALEALAHEYAERAFVVRVLDASEGWLAARHHLSFVPTLLFWREHREVARIKGDPGLQAIRAHLDFLLTGRGRPALAVGPRHTLDASFAGGSSVRPGRPRALLFPGPTLSA